MKDEDTALSRGGLAEAVESHLQAYFAALGDLKPASGLYGQVLHEMERPLLTLALRACDGNQLKAAELLGLNRNTLRKKMTTLGLATTKAKIRGVPR